MKSCKKTDIFILVILILLCPPSSIMAQGTLFVSNLSQSSTGSAVIGNDAWIAQNFTTGTNSGGYSLTSIQLLMSGTSGNPSGFTISIYSSLGNGNPGSNLGSLNGSNPAAGGVYTYTTSGIMLSPSSDYFAVITAATSVSQGSYSWSLAGSNTSSSTLWAINKIYGSSVNGSSWTLVNGKGAFQMAIYATPVPEPSTYSLIVIGCTIFVYVRKRNRFRNERTPIS